MQLINLVKQIVMFTSFGLEPSVGLKPSEGYQRY
jgi:hypothetical protein